MRQPKTHREKKKKNNRVRKSERYSWWAELTSIMLNGLQPPTVTHIFILFRSFSCWCSPCRWISPHLLDSVLLAVVIIICFVLSFHFLFLSFVHSGCLFVCMCFFSIRLFLFCSPFCPLNSLFFSLFARYHIFNGSFDAFFRGCWTFFIA